MSRAGRAPDPGQVQAWGRSVLIIVASVVGGLAAAAVAHASAGLAFAVSIIIGGVVAFAVHATAPQAVERAPGNEEQGHAGWSGGQDGRGPRKGNEGKDGGPDRDLDIGAGLDNERGPDGVVRLTPLPPPASAGSSWWETSAIAHDEPAEPERAVPVSAYLDSAVVAQCPRCGSFGIDADQTQPEWAFRCRACEHGWTWRPGLSWPVVAVRPRLRGRAPRPPS